MNLQDIFYIVGIGTMVVFIILFIVFIAVLLFLKKKIKDVYTLVEKDYSTVKQAITHPEKAISTVGEAITGTVITQGIKLFTSKKKKR